MKTLIVTSILLVSTIAADAQGYARYPSQYGPRGHTYRAPYYGGGLPYRGYNGYHMADRPVYHPPTHYQWYGGNSRAYLGGQNCAGCWGREW